MKSIMFVAAVALALAGCSKGDAGNGGAPAAPAAAKPAPAGQAWTDVVSKTAEGYVMGNPDAPLKLVEYGSRLCPVCGALAREGYDPLTKDYVSTGKVSFEFREFLVHGPADLPPALLGNCVDQAAFFPVLEQMFHDQAQFDDGLQKMTSAQQQALQTAKPDAAIKMLADVEGIVPYMKQRGLTDAKANACLADRAMIDKLTKQTQAKGPSQGGGDDTVAGTPTLILNGRNLGTSVITWDQLHQALKAAGA